MYDIGLTRLDACKSLQGCAERSQEVATHDACNICLAVAMCAQGVSKEDQIGDGVERLRSRLNAGSPIKITADSRVPRVANKLTDMVNVAHNRVQPNRRISTRPSWHEKPVMENGANHAVAGRNGLYLFISEVAVGWRQRTAVSVTGDDWSWIAI